MSGSPQKFTYISISISDCQRIFDLNRYTPEQIVDAIFSTQKTKPLTKDVFAQNFRVYLSFIICSD